MYIGMVTRRSLLKLCGAAAVGLAGCNEVDDDGTAPEGRPPSSERPTPRSPGEGDTIDITDHGAAVDGTTDDTDAVRAAIAAAEPGDVVVFPEGTTLVSTDDKSQSGLAAIPVDGDEHATNLTLRGQGADSVVRLDGGHESNHKVFEVRVRSGIEGFRLERLTVDGAADEQDQPDGEGGWNVNVGESSSDEAVADVALRDIRALNANQNGFRIAHGGCSLVRCTARDCKLHGFAVDSWGDDRNVDPRITVRRCHATGNGLYGIDCSGGKVLVEEFVAENNREGTKTTPEVLEATYRRCRFADNETLGYNRPDSETVTGDRAVVRFTDVIAEGNGWAGLRFGSDTDYRVDTVLARRNNGSGDNAGNIMVRDNAAIDATLVMSYDAQNGTGLRYGSTEPARIGTYVHAGNPGGDLVTDHEGLVIDESYTRRAFRKKRSDSTAALPEEIEELAGLATGGIRDVPTAAEVGAGSG
jgi:hypothetical protein